MKNSKKNHVSFPKVSVMKQRNSLLHWCTFFHSIFQSFRNFHATIQHIFVVFYIVIWCCAIKVKSWIWYFEKMFLLLLLPNWYASSNGVKPSPSLTFKSAPYLISSSTKSNFSAQRIVGHYLVSTCFILKYLDDSYHAIQLYVMHCCPCICMVSNADISHYRQDSNLPRSWSVFHPSPLDLYNI